jgi:glycosyltransferase involved in cell wall biosynthesis
MRSLKILFVSHDAQPHGAQRFLLSLVRWLKGNTRIETIILLGNDGPLRGDFSAISPTFTSDELQMLPYDIDLIYSNTCANAELVNTLNYSQVPVVTHLHELDWNIRTFAGVAGMDLLRRQTSLYVACSETVERMAQRLFSPTPDRIRVIHDCIDTDEIDRMIKAKDLVDFRTQLGLPQNAFLVGAIGTLDWRKGADLFLHVAASIRSLSPRPFYFIWVGSASEEEQERFIFECKRLNLADTAKHLKAMPNPYPFLEAIDLLALTSREDPFPLVMLEAAYLKRPVLAFPGSGGADELASRGAIAIAADTSVNAFAAKLLDLAENPACAANLGQSGTNIVKGEFTIEKIAPKIVEMLSVLAKPPELNHSDPHPAIYREILQIFEPDAHGNYSEERSILHPIRRTRWTRVRHRLLSPFVQGQMLRVDPCAKGGVIALKRLEISDARTGTIYWTVGRIEDRKSIKVDSLSFLSQAGDLTVISNLEVDPQIMIPIPDIAASCPLKITILLIIDPAGPTLRKCLQALYQSLRTGFSYPLPPKVEDLSESKSTALKRDDLLALRETHSQLHLISTQLTRATDKFGTLKDTLSEASKDLQTKCTSTHSLVGKSIDDIIRKLAEISLFTKQIEFVHQDLSQTFLGALQNAKSEYISTLGQKTVEFNHFIQEWSFENKSQNLCVQAEIAKLGQETHSRLDQLVGLPQSILETYDGFLQAIGRLSENNSSAIVRVLGVNHHEVLNHIARSTEKDKANIAFVLEENRRLKVTIEESRGNISQIQQLNAQLRRDIDLLVLTSPWPLSVYFKKRLAQLRHSIH